MPLRVGAEVQALLWQPNGATSLLRIGGEPPEFPLLWEHLLRYFGFTLIMAGDRLNGRQSGGCPGGGRERCER